MKTFRVALAASASFLAANCAAVAQTSKSGVNNPPAIAPASTAVASASAQSPAGLAVFFATGSSSLTPKEQATLDHATRVFNDGKPIVMIITGMADATGAPGPNLLLSQKRADIVFQGLIARGLPPSRFQLLAKGATASLIGQEPSGADQAFRKVEITWR
jgi:outer membrane protein OmpA-like peptidoglycan-associated protein